MRRAAPLPAATLTSLVIVHTGLMSDTNGLFDPADPEYQFKVAEWFQKVTDGPRPQDDIPVQITVRQAQKISAIMGAVARGQDGFNEALRFASWFLDCAQAEARDEPGVIKSMTAAAAWERVEQFPWARPGAPRSQPE